MPAPDHLGGQFTRSSRGVRPEDITTSWEPNPGMTSEAVDGAAERGPSQNDGGDDA